MDFASPAFVQRGFGRMASALSDAPPQPARRQYIQIQQPRQIQLLHQFPLGLQGVLFRHEQQDALIGSSGAEAASAHADSERARAEMENARTNLERYARLMKEGFSTQQQYDSIETAYASAKATYCKRRRWSTKPICNWWNRARVNGKTGRIFSAWRRN